VEAVAAMIDGAVETEKTFGWWNAAQVKSE
jgi:hypothetical protein